MARKRFDRERVWTFTFRYPEGAHAQQRRVEACSEREAYAAFRRTHPTAVITAVRTEVGA